jgi:hypothetical protein
MHQEALLKACDLDDDGYVDWEGFSLAATLLLKSPWAKEKDETDALRAFHGACKLCNNQNCCTNESAVMKMRAELGRLWSLEAALPSTGLVIREDGIPMLPPQFSGILVERVNMLQTMVAQVSQVCCTVL